MQGVDFYGPPKLRKVEFPVGTRVAGQRWTSLRPSAFSCLLLPLLARLLRLFRLLRLLRFLRFRLCPPCGNGAGAVRQIPDTQERPWF